MTENKRYVALPETVSYKDTATDEILCLKVEKDYYEVLSLLNHFHDAWFDVHESLEQISKEYDELHEENQVLRETLKNQYMNEICETCVYGEYWCNYYGEGEFECHKGHKAEDCDQLKECDDFELNIKGMNIHMVEE